MVDDCERSEVVGCNVECTLKGICDRCNHDTFRASGASVRLLVPAVPLARAEIAADN